MNVIDVYFQGLFHLSVFPQSMIEDAKEYYPEDGFEGFSLARRREFLRSIQDVAALKDLETVRNDNDILDQLVYPQVQKQLLNRVKPGDVALFYLTRYQKPTFDRMMKRFGLDKHIVHTTEWAYNRNYPSRRGTNKEHFTCGVIMYFQEI